MKPTANTTTLRDLIDRPDGAYATKGLLKLLDQHGIAVRFKATGIFLANEEELALGIEDLVSALYDFNWMLERKLHAHYTIGELGFDKIMQLSDVHGYVSNRDLKSQQDGEWCRYDRVIFVRYGEHIDAIECFGYIDDPLHAARDVRAAYLALKDLAHLSDGIALAA